MRFKVIRTRLASRRNDIRTHSDRVRAEAAEGVPCPDTGLFNFPCQAGKGSGSEKRMTFASGCAIIFRNDMKEAEK